MRLVMVGLLVLALAGCTDSAGGPLVGTWNGYVEAFAFRSGSDRIRFVIEEHDETAGAVAGSVVLGQGTPPPPATDPDVGYLVGTGCDGSLETVYEGAVYTLLDGRLEERRFRSGYDPYDLWTGWCELQTPRSFGTPGDMGYACLPNWGGGSTGCGSPDPECYLNNPDTGIPEIVDCGKMTLCNHEMVCVCTADGCTVSSGRGRTSFDIALDGEFADGTVTGDWGTHNVRLEREPH